MHRPIALLLSLVLSAPAQAGVPRVVASIAPVHAVVSDVMRGVGEPVLLLPPTVTPHGHAMRPSEAKALDEADLVFWVGPALETFLVRPLKALAGDAEVVALADLPGVKRLPYRDPLHDDQGHAGSGHGHDGDFDPHLWLSLANARAFAAAAAQRLAALDPAHAQRYRDNARGFGDTLDDLEASLRVRLAGVADVPFMVFHDAYQYFEAEMELNNRGAVSLRPELTPGVARMQALRRVVDEADVRCIFGEPQFPDALAKAVVEGTGARIAELDPLGVGIEPGAGAYPALIRRFADTILDCLQDR